MLRDGEERKVTGLNTGRNSYQPELIRVRSDLNQKTYPEFGQSKANRKSIGSLKQLLQLKSANVDNGVYSSVQSRFSMFQSKLETGDDTPSVSYNTHQESQSKDFIFDPNVIIPIAKKAVTRNPKFIDRLKGKLRHNQSVPVIQQSLTTRTDSVQESDSSPMMWQKFINKAQVLQDSTDPLVQLAE